MRRYRPRIADSRDSVPLLTDEFNFTDDCLSVGREKFGRQAITDFDTGERIGNSPHHVASTAHPVCDEASADVSWAAWVSRYSNEISSQRHDAKDFRW
ncbi:MAG: hypothetical protein ABGZ53_07900 [Fuerstiella sp.]